MNKIYKIVWNKALGQMVVVSENAKSAAKGTTVGTHLSRPLHKNQNVSACPQWLLCSLSLSMALVANATWAGVANTALPTGANITQGSAQISQNNNSLNINQNSQNLSTNWNTFNIGKDATVNFNQPNQSSIAVNRVLDNNASQIMGKLNANGQVFLLNPNGVIFSKTAQVNVGGLVASTLNLSDNDIAQGKFTLKNVEFFYPNGHHALKDISMEIRPNKITALVGLSGAGKSTLISLLDKFYEPKQGCIELDGVDVNQIDTQYLRDHIGLVLQKNHIFQGTILDNIRYGKMDATKEQVIQAAEKASIHEQILQLPDGYDSDALQLSGGQQQRIAIARMFLKDPPIIFLDEPTASLDAIASEQIKISLDQIKQGRTVIIISHSLSQIIDADYTYVMKEGEIAEHGEHNALYHQDGVYKQIFDAMAKSLNIDKIAKTFEDDGDEETHS